MPAATTVGTVLEHPLWSVGHRTVRTTRTRREHTVEVLHDGVPLAEVDADGIVRATDGLVLAEAPLFRVAPPPADQQAARPARAPQSAGLWVDEVDDLPAPRGAAHRRPDGARGTAPAAVRASRMRDVEPAVGVTVDVFGVRQGAVRVVGAVEGLRERALEAELLVDGDVAARLRTLGTQAEEAAVRAEHHELARLARYDHLRGVRRTVSSWDLELRSVPDPRVRVLAVVALLRLPALRSAAGARDGDGRRARRR